MLHLLNTTIIPAGCDGLFAVRTISLDEARDVFWEAMAHDGSVFSHVGHEATAALMSEALRAAIAASRTPWDGSGHALVLQLAGRPPEGRVLTVEEMEAAGYTWRLLNRVKEE